MPAIHERPTPCTMYTASGREINLLDPSPRSIAIEDIATSLARLPRFLGHTHEPYTVAQHCYLVSHYCTDAAALAGLLHDAHEAYLGDWTRPATNALRVLGFGDALELLKNRLDQAIAYAFGLEPREFHQAEVRHADLVLLATETRDLRNNAAGDPGLPPPVAALSIRAYSEASAREGFLRRFHELKR